MADLWMGLSEPAGRDELRRALSSIDPTALLTFASSASELRMRVQQGMPRMGAIVGDTGDDVSAINVAAALARDALARDVVLVVAGATDDVRMRAGKAGISRIVDVLDLPDDPARGLDEPPAMTADLPTMLVGLPRPSGAIAASVPLVEPTPVPPVIPPHVEHVPTSPMASPAEPAPVSPVDSPAESVPGLSMVPSVEPIPAPPVEPLRVRPPELEGRKPGDDEPAPAPHLQLVGEPPAPPALRIPAVAGEDSGLAPVIVLVSGRGGVGKTSLVATMAAAGARWGMRVAAIDLDLSCGNLYSCFGLAGPADLAPLAGDHPSDDDLLACGRQAEGGVRVWGPCELPEMAEQVAPGIDRMLELVARDSDVVLVDTATACNDVLAQAAQRCDRLVLVVDGRPGSAVAQARLGGLAVRLGVARMRIARLANRCGPHGRGEPEINRAEIGLETARPLRVMDGGMEVSDCLAEGKAAELLDLGSRFADTAATCLAILLNELGALPDHDAARRALEARLARPRWSFGRRREAV